VLPNAEATVHGHLAEAIIDEVAAAVPVPHHRA
jgi:hypothetical protein